MYLIASEIDFEVWKRCHQLHLKTFREPPKTSLPVTSEYAWLLQAGRSRAKLFLHSRIRITMRCIKSPEPSKLSQITRKRSSFYRRFPPFSYLWNRAWASFRRSHWRESKSVLVPATWKLLPKNLNHIWTTYRVTHWLSMNLTFCIGK